MKKVNGIYKILWIADFGYFCSIYMIFKFLILKVSKSF